MAYTAELDFFRRIMSNMKTETRILDEDAPIPTDFDRNLRSFLKTDEDFEKSFSAVRKKMKPYTVYEIRDGFYCSYIFLLLPDGRLLTVGPYLLSEVTEQMIAKAVRATSVPDQLLSQLTKYYGNIPYFDNKNGVVTLVTTLAESIWGGADNFSFEKINISDDASALDVEHFKSKSDDSLLSIRILEERYAAEAKMMKAISQGLPHKVEQIFSNASVLVFEKRTDDPVRNIKNYLIISNTLFRKGAEMGSVHPFYIDGLSTEFARRIEKIGSVSAAGELMNEMVRRYCSLVKKHSMKDYSLLVQRTLTLVDSDITADLGLKRIASLLNVNASYLSALFKKETGKTLTEHVNQKRIEHAAYLLRTSSLQVQTIAQQCGVLDVNYFAKMFRKYMGKTPKAYREES